MSKNYFEITYKGPFRGNNISLPEDVIPIDYSPSLNNYILKYGEIRTRPNSSINTILAPNDNFPIGLITSFVDANNVFHTVAVTASGLWQLNGNWNRIPKKRQKTWNKIGQYPVANPLGIPVNSAVFINKIFWTNGGTNLWYWDGISNIGAPNLWQKNTAYKQGTQIQDKNGFLQVAQNSGVSGSAIPAWSVTLSGVTTDGTTAPISWINNGKPAPADGFSAAAVIDATNGYTAGAYFLIELNSQLLMLNTTESIGGNFTQRIRWCPSGMPTIWDNNINIGAGWNDELDVPDSITGAFTVGTTAFILRNNGITEVTSTGNAENPFNFDHLWASDRGIGNVFPFGYAAFGPLGIFLSSDEIYNVSLGGFNKIGGTSLDAIYGDLSESVGIPLASIVPYYSNKYIYNHYRLAIPQSKGSVLWNYSFQDQSWVREFYSNINFTGITRWSFVE